MLIAVALFWCTLWILLSLRWIQRLDQRSSYHQRSVAFIPLTAYVEPSYLYSSSNESGLLRLRTHGPEHLVKFTYSNVQSCNDVPDKLPVFHVTNLDGTYGPNVRNNRPIFPVRLDYASTSCPVDADPFLPWIHDVFPSNDGKFIEFVAHNKRRCNTDPKVFASDLENLEPQVALMQPVPVRRMTEAEVRELGLPKSLWSNHQTRYRLATSFSEASEQETRFICQFHRLQFARDGSIAKQIVGETLSIFPYNYELANLRKPGSKPMLTFDANDKHGTHNEQVWNSVLHFSCPVPEALQGLLASGESVVDGSRPTLFLDLVPIRTRTRRTREGYIASVSQSTSDEFNPLSEWGDKHVLPIVESSGRWSHIPLCLTPKLFVVTTRASIFTKESRSKKRQHHRKGTFLWGALGLLLHSPPGARL